MREHKGNSLLIFPSDYTIIDIETTGLSPEYDDIIEICALKYRNKTMIDKLTTLVKPTYPVDDFITALTGITNDMLISAPKIENVIQSVFDFIGSDIIVGHSVNFDINFIYDVCGKHLSKPLTNDFVDTLRIARLLHKEERHNRLSDLAERYHLSYDNAHRAEFDCLLTNEVLSIFNNEFVEKFGENATISSIFKRNKRGKQLPLKSSSISTDKTEFDTDNPIYGKTVVFTGALEKMVRKDAMQIVADYGGINGDNVTQATNYLVLGNNDYCKMIKDGKSGKQKKAELYKLKGYDIEIISENVFYDMINVDSLQLKPKKPVKDTSGLLMQEPEFNINEIECFKLIKNTILSAGLDVSALRCRINSANELVISAFYTVFQVKFRGKKTYIAFKNTVDLTNFTDSIFAIDYKKNRIYINSYNDITNFTNLIIEQYKSCIEYTDCYINSTKSAKKEFENYLCTWYRI